MQIFFTGLVNYLTDLINSYVGFWPTVTIPFRGLYYMHVMVVTPNDEIIGSSDVEIVVFLAYVRKFPQKQKKNKLSCWNILLYPNHMTESAHPLDIKTLNIIEKNFTRLFVKIWKKYVLDRQFHVELFSQKLPEWPNPILTVSMLRRHIKE